MATASLVVSGLTAALSLVSASQQSKGMKMQARAADQAAKSQMLQAKQVEAERTKELNDTIATIDALRAGRGASLDSPTAQVVERQTKKRSADIMLAETLGIREGAQGSRLQAAGLRSSASAALISGYARAGTTLASAFPKRKD